MTSQSMIIRLCVNYVYSAVCKAHIAAKYDDVIKWKHFPRYWPFVWKIHLWLVNSPHKGHWRGALVFSLICAWTNSWVNNRDAGDMRRHVAHHDVIVMTLTLNSYANRVLSWRQLCCHGWRRRLSLSEHQQGSWGQHGAHQGPAPKKWLKNICLP